MPKKKNNKKMAPEHKPPEAKPSPAQEPDARPESPEPLVPPDPPEPPEPPEPPCVASARDKVADIETRIAALEAELKAAKRALCDARWSDEAAAWRAERRIWLTGEGQEVFYRDMTESHLDNAIGLMSLRFGPGVSHPGLKGLLEERARRLKSAAES